jgi:hypothetical protein
MSLTRFIKMPEVKKKIRILRPKITKRIPENIKVVPKSNDYMLIGTAFDYLFRFEILRLVPYAKEESWIAEKSLELIQQKNDKGTHRKDYLLYSDPEEYYSPDIVEKRASNIIRNSKRELSWYRKIKNPSHKEIEKVAKYAILLAKLDSVARSSHLDPQFDQADKENIQEIIEMLLIVPINEFINHNNYLLNPSFGESSSLIGGADTDLIIDDILIDIKTTKSEIIENYYLDQLLGYYILSRNQRSISLSFPKINKLGIYFSRHGYLWTMDPIIWTRNNNYSTIEKWFIEKAKEINELHM